MTDKGMRLAQVISTPNGVAGAERVMLAVAAEAAARGWDQVILNPFSAETGGGALGEASDGIEFEARPCSQLLELPRTSRWLRQRLDRFKPDVVQAYLVHAGILTGVVRHPRDSVYVLSHQHGSHLVEEGRRTLRLLDQRIGKRYDRVVACSEAVERFLLDTYAYPEDLVETIRNGWDGAPLEVPSKPERPTVICTARLRKQKGHDCLVRAFAAVRGQVPNAQLVLVGDGPEEDSLRELVIELGIADAVVFRGQVENVWPELAASDVFVLASRYEPLGIAVLEAMAAGLPVVASNVGGIPELVHEDTGVLVSPGDEAALAEALTTLLRSEERRRSLGAAARARAFGYSMAATTKAYCDLHECLIQERV